MMFPLLAQLVAPPLQEGPVRLPGPGAGEQRPSPAQPSPPVRLELPSTPGAPSPESPQGPESEAPAPELLPVGQMPLIQGFAHYPPEVMAQLLASCSRLADASERLQACAVALTAQLVEDGYVNSRVYVRDTPAPGSLEVVEGRLVEVRVRGSDPWLNRRVQRLLRPLRDQVLSVPRVERDLKLLAQLPGIGSVRGNLARLGSDVAQAVFEVQVEPGPQNWQGELSLSNDGSNGSGEGRAVATLFKPQLAKPGDGLLLYGELNASDAPDLGSVITSVSYTYPLSDLLSVTGAFGFSRRNLVELPPPSDGISTSQYQGLGQLDWVFRETLRQRWSLFAGYSGNRSNTYLNDATLPAIVPDSVRRPSSGFLRAGLNVSGIAPRVGWAGTAYLLQGVAAATPSAQRRELAVAGIEPGQATAIGGLVSAAWGFAPSWQVSLRGGGQVAFNPLTSPMQFTLGSDVGIRGLPSQLISGDSGWLGTGEVSWAFWQTRTQSLQLVPFLGAGGVRTRLPGARFSDTVGAGGILVRWLSGNQWLAELGWVEPFETNNNDGVWKDWLLGEGLYAKVQFRF